MGVVELTSLTRRYGRRRGVESIDLSVPEGCLFGFLGPNGAGKTTAIRVMLGLLRPHRGTARIFGRDCWREGRSIRADVGYVPGDLRLYSWMNGNVALRIVEKVRRRGLMAAGVDLAERFDLDLTTKVREMSRGMRQKLGLILALAHNPRLLVLDEPTASLDPLMQVMLQEHLRRLALAGHTVFFSSHSISEVEKLCDRIAIIREGAIVADESLEKLRLRAGHEVTIRFKDTSTAADIVPPPILEVEQRGDITWRGMLSGPVDELIAWLANHPIEDLRIDRPELDTLFRRFYTRDRDDG